MDVPEARRRLRPYQLPSAYDYPLLLVSAAVALGARQIKIGLDKARLRLSWDSPAPLTPEEWAELFELPLRWRRERARSGAVSLALGLHAALQVATTVRVAAGPLRVALDSKSCQVESGPDGAIEVVVERKSGWFPFRAGLPEEKVLVSRLARCSAQVELNQRELAQPIEWPDCLAMLHSDLEAAPLKTRRGQTPVATKVAAQAFSSVVGVLKTQARSDVEFVVDGVSYTRTPPGWPSGVRAVVAAPSLSRTPSGHDLEQNDDYQSVVRQLLARVAESEELLLRRFDNLDLEADQVLGLCERFQAPFARLHASDQSALLHSRVKALESKLGVAHRKVQIALEELAEHYHAQGEYHKAKPLLNRLAAKKAQEFQDKRRLKLKK